MGDARRISTSLLLVTVSESLFTLNCFIGICGGYKRVAAFRSVANKSRNRKMLGQSKIDLMGRLLGSSISQI